MNDRRHRHRARARRPHPEQAPRDAAVPARGLAAHGRPGTAWSTPTGSSRARSAGSSSAPPTASCSSTRAAATDPGRLRAADDRLRRSRRSDRGSLRARGLEAGELADAIVADLRAGDIVHGHSRLARRARRARRRRDRRDLHAPALRPHRLGVGERCAVLPQRDVSAARPPTSTTSSPVPTRSTSRLRSSTRSPRANGSRRCSTAWRRGTPTSRSCRASTSASRPGTRPAAA